jgi:tRNA(fMet)-specific endonuclease VapC
MRYLLDTNIVSYWMRGDEEILKKIAERPPCDLAMAAITLAEILYGIEKSPHRKKERRKKISLIRSQLDILTFDEHAAEEYSTIRNELEQKGIPISERDLQIASIALSNGLCVVTHNISEFSRVARLMVEDWYHKT